MLKNISLVDLIEIPSERKLTDAGQMIVPCAFARTGGMQYTAAQLGLQDKEASDVITVMRDEADVFMEASLESFRSAPVTIGHPVNDEGTPISVTSENAEKLQVGMLEGMPVRDEDLVAGTLVIARQDAIDLIDEGVSELSAGYTCDIELVTDADGNETYHQRNIVANHIAIVAKGRAGSSCRIADEDEGKETDEKTPLFTDEVLAVLTKHEVEVNDELTVDASFLALDAKITSCKEALEASEAKADLAEAKNKELRDELDASVEERVRVTLAVKEMTDEDLAGKTVHEMKVMALTEQVKGVDLSDKADAYVDAMFDILVDSESAETPMSKLLVRNLNDAPLEVEKKVSVADEARKKMIDRHKGVK